MKFAAASWAAAAFSCAFVAAPYALATGGVRIGSPAPAFAVTDFDGREITLAHFHGRPLVVNVFASWCAACRNELPRFSAAHARYGARVAFLGVDEQEGSAIGRRFAQSMHIPFTVVLDSGPLAANYRATSIPSTIFVDARGIVRAIHIGAMTGAELDRAVAAVGSSSEGART